MYASFFVRPAQQERIETVVELRPETRPALLGTAVDNNAKPIADALAVLYESGGGGQPDRTVAAQYTDELGRFAFAPLEAGKLYLVRIFKSDAKLRMLEQGE